MCILWPQMSVLMYSDIHIAYKVCGIKLSLSDVSADHYKSYLPALRKVSNIYNMQISDKMLHKNIYLMQSFIDPFESQFLECKIVFLKSQNSFFNRNQFVICIEFEKFYTQISYLQGMPVENKVAFKKK